MPAKLICFVVSLIFLHGCNQNSTAPTAPPKTEAAPEPVSTTLEAKQPAIPGAQSFKKDGVTAEIASWDDTQKFIAKQKGKVVVVDLWSTWCEPCLREFPQLVALQKKYPEKVVCISFNLNYDGSKNSPPESNSEELMEYFAKQKADIINIISSTPDEKLYESINLAAIPAAYVYGTDGKLIKRFDNEKQEYGKEGFTYEKDIEPMIDKLLKTNQ
ncbi:TlpA disulfide reductase family protein [uncultured Gimesia sp.]|uniref:TlpA family protein disulfide reductase n=1 Tax=uncultured Gimesia sp. TaxID=1678688 RepID=UPI002633C221|nr:TlpA disulfide reductase family protein [uncultured Gimesia sp.]